MKRALSLLVVLLVGLFIQSAVFAGDEAKADAAEEAAAETTLTGEYVWNRGPTGDLKAVFTETGEGTWDVSFHFDFRETPHTYTGVAKGSMSGKLSGEVKNEDKKRTFSFEGEFKDGVFSGNHEELTPSRAGETGTLTLK